MKKEFMIPGLIGNAASLGVHWIYDVNYLATLSKKQSLLFCRQEKKRYDDAHPSFYAYPKSVVGDVSVQGDIMIWLFEALKANPSLSQDDYRRLLYDQFKPGGTYRGYVEIYAKQMVHKIISKELRLSETLEMKDHHLVNFIPYFVCKVFDMNIDKAWDLAKVFTNDQTFLEFYRLFDALILAIPSKGKEAFVDGIKLAPKAYQVPLTKAIEMTDTNQFIEAYAGRACGVDQALPLIYHLLYHAKTFEEAIERNALMGGASADRAIVIGVLMHFFDKVPKDWVDKVKPLIQRIEQ